MNIEKPTFKHICLMYMQQLTNFPYIEKDFDAITDYQLLCKVVDYLNQVIENINNQNTAITNLYNAFIELKEYVDTYFSEDFPELVNNKLDEMAEDGTLENLINNLLDIIKVYNTFVDVKEDLTIVNGQNIKTLGYYNKGDNGTAFYKITNVFDDSKYQETLDNGLYATLITNNEINTSQIGLISNDDAEGINNIIKLGNALNYGYKILVDDYYYLDTNETFILTNKVLLHGLTKESGFLFNIDSEKTIFNINSINYLDIDNLVFNNLSDNHITLFRITNESNWYIENFNFNNNVVNNSIIVVHANYNINILPVIGTNGFKKVNILNNKFNNLTQVSCFNLFDTIAEEINIKYNYVHNFTNKFFGLTITNGGTYESEIRSNVLLTNIDYNYVICDNDYLEESSAGAGYYTFILLEGNLCYYTNNHVEGMKSFDAISLYDAYLSVNILYSHDNVYKNNLSFNANSLTYLLESKSGRIGLERYYNNNQYIIEDEWQSLFDNTFSKCAYFLRLQSIASKYEITNCYFDIAYLGGLPSQQANAVDYGTLIFKNNYMHIKRGISGRLLFFGKSTYEDRQMIIDNNTIINDDNTLIICGVSTSATYKKFNRIIINHNTFSIKSLVNTPGCSYLEICDNELNFTDTDCNIIYSGSTQSPTINFKNNNITINGTSFLMSCPTGNNIVDIKNELYGRFINKLRQGFLLASDITTDKVYRYFFEYEILHTTGKQIFSFNLDYGKDETGNYIIVTDTNNESQTLHISDSGINIKVDNQTSVTLSTARVATNNSLFHIIPVFNYAISGVPYFIKQTIKSVEIVE